MSSDAITLAGLVATVPRNIVTSEGLAITSFRVASSQRRFDRSQERWIDVETNWYTVTTFRQLAHNVAASIEKGQRVVVRGRLRIREWDNGEKVGTTVEIEAESVGHDLLWGTSSFTRNIMSSSVSAPIEVIEEEASPRGENAAAGAHEPTVEADEVPREPEYQAPFVEREPEPSVPF